MYLFALLVFFQPVAEKDPLEGISFFYCRIIFYFLDNKAQIFPLSTPELEFSLLVIGEGLAQGTNWDQSAVTGDRS